jgi:hypothetical protein
MADKGILFSAPMVRALLREIEAPGTGKTQTRRAIPEKVLDAYSEFDDWCNSVSAGVPCSRQSEREFFTERSRFKVGDWLYVREHWRVSTRHDATAPRDMPPKSMTVFFEAGGSIANHGGRNNWRPDPWPALDISRPEWVGRFRQGMHMPKWASRIALEVIGVRVERLQAISPADAMAEGLITVRHASALAREKGCDWGFEGDDRYGSPVSAYAALWDHINGAGAWDSNPWVAVYEFRPRLGNIDLIGGRNG